MGEVATPNIILYTSYICPWAHRAQIILKELGLPFETVHIDLSVPRAEEYLKINPRGLVPSLKYNGEILTESGIICQFLADAHPSYILPPSTAKNGPLIRARTGFFVDTYFSKVQNQFYPLLNAIPNSADHAAKTESFIASVVKEIEPLLQDASPFFGGNEKLGLAEVMTGSFVLRVLRFPEHGLFLGEEGVKGLKERAPAFWRWASAVAKEESVTYIWDEERVITLSKRRIEKSRADAAAAK